MLRTSKVTCSQHSCPIILWAVYFHSIHSNRVRFTSLKQTQKEIGAWYWRTGLVFLACNFLDGFVWPCCWVACGRACVRGVCYARPARQSIGVCRASARASHGGSSCVFVCAVWPFHLIYQTALLCHGRRIRSLWRCWNVALDMIYCYSASGEAALLLLLRRLWWASGGGIGRWLISIHADNVAIIRGPAPRVRDLWRQSSAGQLALCLMKSLQFRWPKHCFDFISTLF